MTTIHQNKIDAIVSCIAVSLENGPSDMSRAERLNSAFDLIRKSGHFDTAQIAIGINEARKWGIITDDEAKSM